MMPIRIRWTQGAARIKTISTVRSGLANRRGAQLFSCSWFRSLRNSSCRISANALESRSPRRWLATLLMTTSSPACGEARGRNTSSPSGNTASPIGDRLSASGWRSSRGTTSKNRSRTRGRRTRPRTVTRTRSVDGSSDVFVSSASRLIPTWNGSRSTDMPPKGVTYQCRNVSTGKVGAGLPGSPRLRCTDEKLPAPVFVISVSKIRLESTTESVATVFVTALDTLIYNTDVRRNQEGLYGYRIRPDRHRTDAGKGSLPEAHEDQGHRRAVPAVRGVRPDREGRGRFLRRDRQAGRLEDPVDRGREGHEDARARGFLRIHSNV